MNGESRAQASAWETWPIDREIVFARVIAVKREIAFQAWADPSQIVQWFGPDGMTIETHEIDIRVGGTWRFDMVTKDGSRFSNRIQFLRIESPTLIELEHGTDTADDPGRFRMLVTFDSQNDGKTVVTLRQMHPSKEHRDNTVGFGAVEYGTQTLRKLAAHAAVQ